ncbi:hypothetical protein ACFQZJ_05520 [Maribacter chungangensis]|uniref:Four helix bundle protein n=1 Tax=Maribacter chungangensis TaxID=1069117 RepID=A0ABW3B0U7_9FLAO
MARKNLQQIPIYRKAMDLCIMSREIASYVSLNKNLLTLYESNSLRDSIANSLLTDTILIPQKIVAAEFSTSSSERMHSISFINIMIRNINSYCRGLEKDGVKEIEYLNLLRSELRSFRKHYKKWKISMN